jgi:hypothetical protein
MPLEAQISANRRNAKLSTGPRTQAGRARSALNATKSGIYAKSEIIPGEDPAELEALKSRIYDSIQPSPEETPLVDQLIGADWQFRRLRRAEADTWTMSITGDRELNRKKGRPEDTNVYYRAMEDNKDTFERIYRLQASTARILTRSLETLVRLRKLNLLQPEPEECDETNPIPETVTAPPIPNPAPEAPKFDATPPQIAETNPILEPPNGEAAAHPSGEPASSPKAGETNPIPQTAVPASAPPVRYWFRNGKRYPIR